MTEILRQQTNAAFERYALAHPEQRGRCEIQTAVTDCIYEWPAARGRPAVSFTLWIRILQDGRPVSADCAEVSRYRARQGGTPTEGAGAALRVGLAAGSAVSTVGALWTGWSTGWSLGLVGCEAGLLTLDDSVPTCARTDMVAFACTEAVRRALDERLPTVLADWPSGGVAPRSRVSAPPPFKAFPDGTAPLAMADGTVINGQITDYLNDGKWVESWRYKGQPLSPGITAVRVRGSAEPDTLFPIRNLLRTREPKRHTGPLLAAAASFVMPGWCAGQMLNGDQRKSGIGFALHLLAALQARSGVLWTVRGTHQHLKVTNSALPGLVVNTIVWVWSCGDAYDTAARRKRTSESAAIVRWGSAAP